MSGGSEQRESPHDKQCEKCGLWYQDKGPSFAMHEASCSGDGGASDDESDEEADTGGSESGEGLGVSDVAEDDSGGAAAAQETTDGGGDETVDCPHCGEDTNEPESTLAGGTWQCTECGGQFEVTED